MTVAYTLATLLAGIGALVVLVTTVFSPDTSDVEVLLWGALAALLFVSAAREWWCRDRELERSQRTAHGIEPEEVQRIAEDSSGEVDTIRKLRVAHPGLRLQDAYELVKSPQR